jgi:hypothetical protein
MAEAIKAFFLGLGFMIGFSETVRYMLPPDVAVDLRAVSLSADGGTVIYERRVRAPKDVRAVWAGAVVDVRSERAVPECDATGQADYRRSEPERQEFSFEEFFGPGCAAALEECGRYQIWAGVTPIAGGADDVRSQEFTWPIGADCGAQ